MPYVACILHFPACRTAHAHTTFCFGRHFLCCHFILLRLRMYVVVKRRCLLRLCVHTFVCWCCRRCVPRFVCVCVLLTPFALRLLRSDVCRYNATPAYGRSRCCARYCLFLGSGCIRSLLVFLYYNDGVKTFCVRCSLSRSAILQIYQHTHLPVHILPFEHLAPSRPQPPALYCIIFTLPLSQSLMSNVNVYSLDDVFLCFEHCYI